MATFQSQFQDIVENTNRDIRELSEIVTNKFKTSMLSEYFTIVPNIKGGLQVGITVPGEKVTTGPSAPGSVDHQDFDVEAIHQRWDPRQLSVRIRLNYQNLESHFTAWLLGNGHDRVDLRSSQILNWLLSILNDRLSIDAYRIALLGGDQLKDGADSSSAAGVRKILTRDSDEKYYNRLDKGLLETLVDWKAN